MHQTNESLKHIFICTTHLAFYQIEKICQDNNIHKKNVVIINTKNFKSYFIERIENKFPTLKLDSPFPDGKLSRFLYLRKLFTTMKNRNLFENSVFYIQNLDNYLCNWISSKSNFNYIEDGFLNIYGYNNKIKGKIRRYLKFIASISTGVLFDPFFLNSKKYQKPLYITFPSALVKSQKIYSEIKEITVWETKKITIVVTLFSI
nr:hypothetical protein [Providencia rettgeri]